MSTFTFIIMSITERAKLALYLHPLTNKWGKKGGKIPHWEEDLAQWLFIQWISKYKISDFELKQISSSLLGINKS